MVKMNPSGLVDRDVIFIDTKPLKFPIDCVDFSVEQSRGSRGKRTRGNQW